MTCTAVVQLRLENPGERISKGWRPSRTSHTQATSPSALSLPEASRSDEHGRIRNFPADRAEPEGSERSDRHRRGQRTLPVMT